MNKAKAVCVSADPGALAEAPGSELAWLDEFRRRHGRAPRILHVGNIANNAYNNAKVLNKAGFDCDVLCPDYYHIMGCPEWEDADFSGDVGDHFRPNWFRLDLKGFERPHWFAQGPFELSVRYLIARRRGRLGAAETLWRRLARHNGTGAPRSGWQIAAPIDRLFDRVRFVLHKLQDMEAVSRQVDRTFDRQELEFGAQIRILRTLHHYAKLRAKYALLIVSRGLRALARILRIALRPSSAELRHQAKIVCAQFSAAFPERPDQLSWAEVAYFASQIDRWRALFEYYDVVQAYSTHVIYPMLANVPYIGFEHGTLREIPFEGNATGRLTALGYRGASAVLVTNSDCLNNARRLATGTIRFINHPYDEDHGLEVKGAKELRQTLYQELDAEFLVFFPTRQDWVKDKGFADKANDVFIRGFARLRASGYAVGMVCCEWGRNVPQSKELLHSLGVERHVRWRQPMGIVRFERYVSACDLVADQFMLGAFGGVLFKAMSVGVPVCTYLDRSALAGRFPEPPPVINCRTEEDVANSLENLIRNRDSRADYSRRGRAWIKSYHSAAQVVAAQAELYGRLCQAPSAR